MGLIEIDKVYDVAMTEILCDMEFNCRTTISPESVVSLAQSIEVNGLQTPIHIQEREDKITGCWYRIISGHRRYRAHELLEWDFIKAIIFKDINEQHAKILNLSENMDREDLTPYEEAMAMTNIFPEATSLVKMSKILQRSPEWCRRRKLIADLPEDIRLGFHDGRLGIRDIAVLSTLPKHKREKAAWKLILAREKCPKHTIPMGSVIQKHPHRNTQEIKDLIQYFTSKKMDGLVTKVLRWVLGYGETIDIKRMAREADQNYRRALYEKD